MTSTIGSLFAAAEVSPAGVVSWGTRIPAPEKVGLGTGVYVVAVTDAPCSMEAAMSVCPIAAVALQEFLDIQPELTLDGVRPDADALGKRLAAFWCPDEVVVYIGRAGPRRRITVSELSDRVKEYYSTRLGAPSPHSGGWPLKTLGNLGALHVHYAYCDDVVAKEQLMLQAFADAVSVQTRVALYDSTRVMPFANLEDGKGRRKAHRIGGARAPSRVNAADAH